MSFKLKFAPKEETLEDKAIKSYRKYESEKERKKKEKKKKKKEKEDKLKAMIESIDIDALKEIDDRIDDTRIVSSKRGRKKKADKDTYEYFFDRFKDESDIYYKMLEENIKFEIEAREFLDKLKKTGVRNIKAVSEMYSNVNTAKKTVLDNIKEISNIKKTASDLEQKMTRIKGVDKSEDEKSGGDKALMDMFQHIQTQISPSSDFYDPTAQYIDPNSNNHMIDEMLENDINQMEQDGLLEFTAAEKNLEYEAAGIKVAIKVVKNDDTDEWKLLAFNEQDNPLYDYEVPPKESLGKVTFYDVECYVEDRYGRKYDLLSVDDDLYDDY